MLSSGYNSQRTYYQTLKEDLGVDDEDELDPAKANVEKQAVETKGWYEDIDDFEFEAIQQTQIKTLADSLAKKTIQDTAKKLRNLR